MKFKNFAFATILFLGISAAPNAEHVASHTAYVISDEDAACKYGQCYATAKSTNQRCKHCVSNSGDTYCYQHK